MPWWPLSTAGGLVFHGEPDGNVQAYDTRAGDLLWQWQTGFGADGPPVTHEIDGVPYVAIAIGGNRLINSARGDAVWAFTLNGRLQPAEAPAPPPSVQSSRLNRLARTAYRSVVNSSRRCPGQ